MRGRIFDQLQSVTRLPCSVAEAEVLAFFAHCDCDQYRAFLVRCFGFESPLESACSMAPELASHGATSRPRSRYIAHDLVGLGFSPEKLLETETCVLRAFRDLSQALGWLYVAERNVITNQRCHRQLASRAPELAQHASYLDCYGAITEARWQHFGDVLDQIAERADPERIEAVAIESYNLLRRWLLPVRCTWQARPAAPVRSSAS